LTNPSDAADLSKWYVRPHWELGIAVPVRLEFVRAEDVAFAILGIVAYTTGFSFRFSARLRVPHDLFLHPIRARGDLRLATSWKPPGLAFDVQFADGRRSVGGGLFPWPRDPSAERDGTTLTLRSSHGGGARTGRSWDSDVWLGPLPSPGPLAFVYEWPDHGIELTRREVDAQPILDAAHRSKPLW
jgi:hypothetical protein